MQLDEIKKFGKEHGVPISLDDTLVFLLKTINENHCKQILEIGTAIGYSSIAMAVNTNCDHIDTVEIESERYALTIENIKSPNLQEKFKRQLS